MPLYAWIKCTEGKDMTYVCKDPSKADGVNLGEAWCIINDDYINRFGLHELYKRLLKKMKEKALLELDYVITKNKFKLTEVSIAEAELRSMMANRGEGISIQEALIPLSKWVGYRINPKEFTVMEFFLIRDRYGKENKQKRHK